MENATQALYIAVGVLIGILILSLIVYLYTTMGGYAANTQKEVEKNNISKFNDEFLKYSRLDEVNIQDVITVKNYALETNKEDANYNPDVNRANNNNGYIDVYLNQRLVLKANNEQLLKNKMKSKFTCRVEINSTTGLVNRIYFTEI